MKEVLIEHKPLWKFVIKYKRTIPEKWHEMTATQLIAISAAQYEKYNDRQLVRHMYSLSRLAVRAMNSYQIFVLLKQLEFMNTFTPVDRFLIKNINGLRAPQDRLANMWFGQFIFADTYFIDYIKTLKPDTLNKFIAALYLPKDSAFDENMIDKWALRTAKIKEEIKYAIVINYRLLYEWLSASYPLLFAKKELADNEDVDLAKTPKNKKTKPGTSANWIIVFDNIVGGDIVNSKRYARLPVNTVFRFIVSKIKEHHRKK